MPMPVLMLMQPKLKGNKNSSDNLQNNQKVTYSKRIARICNFFNSDCFTENADSVCVEDRPLSDCEAVSQSAYCNEITRIRRVVFDLLSEPVYIDHDGILVDDGLAPDYAVDHVF